MATTPMIPQIDMLDFLTLPDQSLNLIDQASGKLYSRQTHGLTGPAGPAWDVVNMTKDTDGFGKRYRIKANHPLADPFPGGWPWDITRIGDNICLDWITENGWDSPKNFKKNVKNYIDPITKKVLDGKPMFPRFISGMSTKSLILIPEKQTGYVFFKNCTSTEVPSYVGDNAQLLYGPVLIDHGGTIGRQPTMVHQYFWDGVNGVYAQKEENFYVYRYGWTVWSVSLFNKTKGEYEVQQVTIRNSLLATPPPAVVFPCF